MNEFLSGRKVVHGHTPKMRVEIEKRFEHCLEGSHRQWLCSSDGILHFQKNCE